MPNKWKALLLQGRTGALVDPPDIRDFHLRFDKKLRPIVNIAEGDRRGTFPLLPAATRKDKVDLRKKMPPIDDQDKYPFCTAFTLSGWGSWANHLDVKPSKYIDFCETWLYYEGRVEAGLDPDGQPEGIYIRSGLEVMRKKGILPEREYKYQGNWGIPKPGGLEKAANYKIQLYTALDNKPETAELVLAQTGPIAATFKIYANWEGCLGHIEKPNYASIGHHSVLVVGFDKKKKQFIIRNSWGPQWGESGYASMDYEYYQSQCVALYSIVDVKGSKDLYPLSDWEKVQASWPQWLKDLFGIEY
jgi:hypothetical protein